MSENIYKNLNDKVLDILSNISNLKKEKDELTKQYNFNIKN